MSEQVHISDAVAAYLKAPHRQFIGGRWVDAESDTVIDVEDPATEQVISTVQAGALSDVDRAVKAARQALQGPWSRMTSSQRGHTLYKYADLLDANAVEIAQLETLENGMPHTVAQTLVKEFVVDLARYYAGWPTKIEGSTIPASPLPLDEVAFTVLTLREPIGVVGAIIPWNVPSTMVILKLGPALAAGCTVVLKPAELTPLVAQRMVELAEEAGVPPGVVNLIQGYGEEVGAALAAHDGVDKVAFTGSTEVGKKILGLAAGNLKKVSLELGGKSPVIIFPDADMELAVPAAARACYLLSGQNCMAGTRLFVHEAIYETFVEGLAEVSQQYRVGNGFAPDTLIGPLISAQQRERVLGYIEKGQQEGGEIITGGSAPSGPGYFVEPTVLVNTHQGMQIVQEEVFGPVFCVQKFSDDLQELAARVNDSKYALSGSVWTRDIQTALTMAKLIDAGQIGINYHAAVTPETPFGGNKQSGWGREFGKESLDAYLKTKAISIRSG